MSPRRHDAELEERLELALEALDDGRVEEALETLAALPADFGPRWAHATSAWIELGELARAEESLATARRLLPPGDPRLSFAEGRLRLQQWRIPEAKAAFERLLAGGDDEAALESLALIADLEDDPGRAERLLRQLQRLDPQAYPVPSRLSPDAFQAAVREAAEELEADFRQALEGLCVVIDPMPTRALVDAPASGHAPDVLGLFVGRPLNEPTHEGVLEHPPTIFLFQRNLERACADRETLVEEIRTTLYHELGHYLGFDEEGVEDLGLG